MAFLVHGACEYCANQITPIHSPVQWFSNWALGTLVGSLLEHQWAPEDNMKYCNFTLI